LISLQERLGYRFHNGKLLVQALTHKSFHNENSEQSPGHNERLEFLGDAVLDLVLSDLLMQAFPDFPEGDLSKIRASFVNESVLADMARECGFDRVVRLGRGEILTGGMDKPRILASVLEAIIGAYYLDAGFLETFKWVRELFSSRLENLDLSLHFAMDYKTRLQELVQERYREAPKYVVTNSEGPDHEKTFYVEVSVDEQVMAKGQGRSKKVAEQEAARLALETLK